ncbi:MAG: FtsX-like permease family protein [Candidatus Aminicenantes bacterium]|nr:FtsX-like permease family protein [Candidatus Aminicenantes bacterium]
MKAYYIFRMFYRELKIQRKRITLTIFALAWGTFSIVVLLAFGEGLNRQMMKATHGLGEGIVFIYSGQTSKPYKGLGKGRRIFLREEDIDLLRNRIPRIELISPENDRSSNTMIYGRKTITERVIGVFPSFGEMRKYYPERGSRFINSLDLKNKKRVIFLGNDLKDKLFGPEEAVGKSIMVNSIPFLVIGVMKDKLQNSMYNGPDSQKAAIPFTTYQAIYGDKYLDRLIYKPSDVTQSESVKKEVYRILAEKYKFDPDDTQALNVWDMVEEEELMTKIFFGIEIFMSIIGSLTLIVAGVGVANIMYVSAKRRTKEIGIKMAIGAKKKHVLLQFISEALMIAFIGGAGGVLGSFLLVELFKFVPLEGFVADLLAHPVISVDIMILTALILGIIGFLAGIFPARKAASQNPVEALRYE